MLKLGGAFLTAALGWGALAPALADIPREPVSDDQRRGGFERQIREAGHSCPRITRMERWTGPWAARLEARQLQPYVVECLGGARLVVANARDGWRQYDHYGPPYPGEQPNPYPQPVVWRFD